MLFLNECERCLEIVHVKWFVSLEKLILIVIRFIEHYSDILNLANSIRMLEIHKIRGINFRVRESNDVMVTRIV